MVEQDKMIYGTEEAIAKLIMEILRTGAEKPKEKTKLLTDLSPEEIHVLTLLSTIGENMNIKVLKEFCLNFCQYKVSKNRLGRKEMVGIATFNLGDGTDKKGRKSIKDLFSGLRA